MGIAYILLLLLSIVVASVGIKQRGKRKDLFIIISLTCFAIVPVLSIFDINCRVAAGDVVGVIDIYPTMGIIYCAVLIIILVLTVINILGKPRTREEN